MGVVAAAGAAVAVWLLVPRLAEVPAAGAARWPRTTTRGSMRSAAPFAVVAATVVATVQGTTLALALIGLGVAAAARRLSVRARQRRLAQQRGDLVVEVCEALAGELAAGQPPVVALRHCVEVWPELEPAARTGELDGDVPAALRRLSRLPGASGLTEVAGAWQVSQRAGGTMATALGRVARSGRRRRATDRVVASELASAQATARLMAVLPVLVLALGAGLGGDPWRFLLTHPVGLGCLAAGLALAYTGLAWIERIAAVAGSP